MADLTGDPDSPLWRIFDPDGSIGDHAAQHAVPLLLCDQCGSNYVWKPDPDADAPRCWSCHSKAHHHHYAVTPGCPFCRVPLGCEF